MEQAASEPMAGAGLLAGGPEGDPPDPGEGVMIQDVIISVSLDELDGLSGDMLV